MIDIHSHNSDKVNYLKVFNYPLHGTCDFNFSSKFSVGIHPWFLENYENQFAKQLELIQHPNCIAIGECGLDKVCNSPIELQKDIFIKQCNLAIESKKPLIIHCVKAHFDVIKILQEFGIKKALFHGFNNKYTILEKILEANYSVSFGHAILDDKSQATALIKLVPTGNWMLETDNSAINIELIYSKASELTGISLEELINQQKINFSTFTV